MRIPTPDDLNQRWSLDVVTNELATGRRFGVLTVLDSHSRECLALEADASLPAPGVTEALDRIIMERGSPVALTLDNGAEFTSKHFERWAYTAGIQLDFIPPGKPIENSYIELQRQALPP